jgi:hypothetical protein
MADIESCPPRPHHASLLAVFTDLIPDCPCRFALTRGGWYRSGGVVRADGERVAERLEDWVEQEMAACGDDLAEFLDRHGEAELLVTRHTGRTHYFVAPYGAGAAEFLQIEVEELQETLDRRLWDATSPPEDAQELLDPLQPASVAPTPLGPSRYAFRRISDLRQVAARLPAPVGEVAPLVRFLKEWESSRAGAHFSDHWVVGLREHHDRYNNVVLSAAPASRHARELKPFHWNTFLSGVDAANQLHAFDRAAGYSGDRKSVV